MSISQVDRAHPLYQEDRCQSACELVAAIRTGRYDNWDAAYLIERMILAERERIAMHFDAKAEDARQKQMRAGNSFCSGNDWSIYGAKVERYKAVAAEIRNLKPE